MLKKINLVFVSAILFTCLFYRQYFGLNVFIFESIFLIWLFITKQFSFHSKNQTIFGIGFILTSLLTVLVHSDFNYFVHVLACIVFVGMLIYSEMKSIIFMVLISVRSFFSSQLAFINSLTNSDYNGNKLGIYIKRIKIFLIPIFIIFIFMVIYQFSSPAFSKLVSAITENISSFLEVVFKDFDFLIIVVFLIGLALSNYIINRIPNAKIIEKDNSATDFLKRIKTKKRFYHKLNSLKNEYLSAVFLFIVLNIILLVFNLTEIKTVWFNFSWEGQYLKEFVHEGAFMLILSILISIALVLYFFRENLNFYSKNKLLKILSFIWLIQNAILTISVAIRNFKYIDYFSLAHKRIGVIIFLLLTVYGLYTVFVKVKYKKSSFYLFRSNALAIYIVLIFSSIVNWDKFIADYNFKHSENSFLHLDYLAGLSDEALPILDKPIEELKQIDSVQKNQFDFRFQYMSPEDYVKNIAARKVNFVQKWEEKSFLSWNLPEHLAYKKLKENKETNP